MLEIIMTAFVNAIVAIVIFLVFIVIAGNIALVIYAIS